MFKLLSMLLLVSMPIVSLASVTDLKEAIDQDDLIKVKIIIKADKALLEQKINEYFTPLNYAAVNSKTEIAKFLIDFGADLNAKDKEGSSPLHNSAAKSNYDISKYLIDKGADVNFKDMNDVTPLHFACMSGNLEIVKYMVKKGAEVNAVSKAGNRPVSWSVVRNQVEAIKFLKENKADVSYINENGQNLLFAAAGRKAKESFKLLLSYGLDINSKDKYNNTPIRNAVYSGKDMVEFLLTNGSDPAPKECMNGNTCKIEGRTPLHNAMYTNDVEVVKLLIDHKAPVDIQDKDGTTSLILAIRNGSTEIVTVLLENNANPNLQENVLGQAPLHIAASKGYLGIVELLLENGAKLNSEDNKGNNALYLATFHKNKDVVKSLLLKGADIKDLKTLNNYTDYKNGEAKIWFLGHSGWAIKTKDHLLVFDYWENNRVTKPNFPNINNGYLDPEQLKDENIIVFISHSHQDHYQASLFDWEKKYSNVKYIVGFDPKKDVKNISIMEGRKTIKIDGVEINTIPSTDAGVGFLVKTNDLTILHPGDHANMSKELNGPYVKEIDYLATLTKNVDISFFPVTGCNFRDKVSLKMGIKYAIDKFNPKIVFPMHCGNNEGKLKEFMDEALADGIKANFECASCKGDNFIYKNGDVVENR
ncbi:MAG: hypothetical protein GQ534_12410 [Candidatus Delongbacteria bacterium]|nr:hypothetical protein [Candidatus Delongbacteria bacterium]